MNDFQDEAVVGVDIKKKKNQISRVEKRWKSHTFAYTSSLNKKYDETRKISD